MNYLFGRLLYDFIKTCWKGMYYLFVVITCFMFYCVYYGLLVLYMLLKLLYIGIKESCLFTTKCLIKLKEKVIKNV